MLVDGLRARTSEVPVLRPASIVLLSMLVLAAPSAVPAQTSLADNVEQAVTILQKFREIPEQSIPESVVRDAKGLAILTVLKAGFLFSGQGGLGLVVARFGKSWSGPSAIATGGAGFGFQVGAQVTEYVIVLNTDDAVRAFSRGGNVTPVAAVYTYSRSQGLFAGISLEGEVIATRDSANEKYYGRKVTAEEILSGRVKPPASADRLRKELEKF
jgi:lipid-binding SYLF domain-containing protein